MQFVLSSLELLLHKIALKSFKKKQPTKSFLHWRTAEANIKWIFIVWLYRDGGGVCATTYSWQWLLFELSNENETGDYRVILQDNDKDGRALSGVSVPRHLSRYLCRSCICIFSFSWIRTESESGPESGSKWSSAVGSALDQQLGSPVVCEFSHHVALTKQWGQRQQPSSQMAAVCRPTLSLSSSQKTP